MARFNGSRMVALFLCVLFALNVSFAQDDQLEEATWGEVKQSLTRPAGKIADHEGTRIEYDLSDPEFLEYLREGAWESRRFNDNSELEVVQYVFRGEGTQGDPGDVTLYRTNITTEESSEPQQGSWWADPDIGIVFEWAVDPLSTGRDARPDDWWDVNLHVNDEADWLVLDFNSRSDKELRTLSQDRSPWNVGGLRNWLVEWVEGGSVSVESNKTQGSASVRNGQWVRADFTVQAADGHLPNLLKLYIEGNEQVHILSIPAYYGSEEVPQVNLCGPISGIRWQSSRTLTLSMDNNDGGGIFITGCGTARATVHIYAPEANIGADRPLASIRVRTGG